jgi:hypothetical protein
VLSRADTLIFPNGNLNAASYELSGRSMTRGSHGWRSAFFRGARDSEARRARPQSCSPAGDRCGGRFEGRRATRTALPDIGSLLDRRILGAVGAIDTGIESASHARGRRSGQSPLLHEDLRPARDPLVGAGSVRRSSFHCEALWGIMTRRGPDRPRDVVPILIDRRD